MIFNRVNFFRCLVMALAVCVGFDAISAPATNPRGVSSVATRDSESANVSRSTVARSASRGVDGRASARGAVVSNAMRGAANVSRSATTARTATTSRSTVTNNASRASMARATAIFNDVSKIGGGYAACRESYATCMDQFCANANDTYRRCYCSSRYTEFRNTENALDQAKTLLMQFEDNNLNAVDKTAAEVNAMYSATVGEAAIKNDTSAAAKILDEIGDLLSGKKKATYSSNNSTTSLGVLSFDLSDDLDDIWSSGGNSIFSNNGGQNLSELDGVELYNAANKQCMNISTAACESSAVANMARSSYGILITQDCNAYQKNIDKKLENVKQTVRTAEKYLREARLAEYRAHNSADVNECISKVRAALTADTACGANYKRCLDYTGAYINQTTGDAIYSPRLFQLTDLITLAGVNSNTDVLEQNPNFNKFLESRKIFATAALDGCRDIASTVWNEFKRTALIEIAQAQDEKIEEIKMSCVSTMADCYDTQSSALKDFDNTTAQMAGAISAYAAKQMCMDKVSACAALYSPGEGSTKCNFNNDGKLTNSTACGLTALLKFVDTVDTIRINEGCETALRNYATELCTPASGGMGYPWNCRLLSVSEIEENITNMAGTYCNLGQNATISVETTPVINNLITDISMQIANAMMEQCEELNGVWYDGSEIARITNPDYETAFYRNVYGTTVPQKNKKGSSITEYGICVKNTVKYQCEVQDVATGGAGYAKYNATNETCTLSNEWYQYKCEHALNGYWNNGICYTKGN